MEIGNHTIAAVATAPGRGGIGIVRVSGELATTIAKHMLGCVPVPQKAQYHSFFDEDGAVIDMGIAIFFPKPHSFTGEDVVEYQGHGGPVVMDLLLKRIISLGATLAKPGEFSERAYLNNKISLNEAEAIADLIDSASSQAAKLAVRSLQGAFSERVHQLVNQVIELRCFVEAAIDFPEEEIDFLSDEKINNDLDKVMRSLDDTLGQAKQGALLREGMSIAIIGKPNAGKSSLLNCLSGRSSAIVTDIPGTTRDVLKEHILIDGIPLNIVDTAGLRETVDIVEQEGVRRAFEAMNNADQVLLVVDSQQYPDHNLKKIWPEYDEKFIGKKNITLIRNKVDLTKETVSGYYKEDLFIINMSAKTAQGLDILRRHLKACVNSHTTLEGGFIARRRHLDALNRARSFLIEGQEQLLVARAGELLAENLRQVQSVLGEITGKFTSDDLLGEIFSNFCIGK